MFAFVEQNVIPFIYQTSTIAEKVNVAVGKYSMRITMRFVKNMASLDNSTN